MSMYALEELMRIARTSASFRDHTLGTFAKSVLSRTDRAERMQALATCVKCGMEVQCLTHPQANEIDIGGEAVALNCKGKS